VGGGGRGEPLLNFSSHLIHGGRRNEFLGIGGCVKFTVKFLGNEPDWEATVVNFLHVPSIVKGLWDFQEKNGQIIMDGLDVAQTILDSPMPFMTASLLGWVKSPLNMGPKTIEVEGAIVITFPHKFFAPSESNFQLTSYEKFWSCQWIFWTEVSFRFPNEIQWTDDLLLVGIELYKWLGVDHGGREVWIFPHPVYKWVEGYMDPAEMQCSPNSDWEERPLGALQDGDRASSSDSSPGDVRGPC
jgi:hypothetical protein